MKTLFSILILTTCILSQTFTLGSSKNEVLEAMGTPTAVYNYYDEDDWKYDYSSIHFKNNKVIGYSNISENLKVCLTSDNNNRTAELQLLEDTEQARRKSRYKEALSTEQTLLNNAIRCYVAGESSKSLIYLYKVLSINDTNFSARKFITHIKQKQTNSTYTQQKEIKYTTPTAENGSYYGQLSTNTGNLKTVYVNGYYRKNGTYVRSHYRSK